MEAIGTDFQTIKQLGAIYPAAASILKPLKRESPIPRHKLHRAATDVPVIERQWRPAIVQEKTGTAPTQHPGRAPRTCWQSGAIADEADLGVKNHR